MKMPKEYVQKISKQLAGMADGIISQSACLTFWGEVELPKCMRQQNDKKTKTR